MDVVFITLTGAAPEVEEDDDELDLEVAFVLGASVAEGLFKLDVGNDAGVFASDRVQVIAFTVEAS